MTHDGMGHLTRILASLKDPAEIEQFLREILTPCEFHDLALRWELLELLTSGMPQRKIAEKLGVSLCKITRGVRILRERESIVAGFVAVPNCPEKEGAKARPKEIAAKKAAL